MSLDKKVYSAGNYIVRAIRLDGFPDKVTFRVSPQGKDVWFKDFNGTSLPRTWYTPWRKSIDEASDDAFSYANRMAGIDTETEAFVIEAAGRLKTREKVLAQIQSEST